jgi:DNA-binding MarR family transcriptional regulator/ribosomal protein S18 acetylase RimI-like enzyme
MKYLQELGILALASRLKMLSEKMMADGISIYKESNLNFEPRWFPVTYYLKTHGPTPLTTIAKALNQSHPAVVQVVRIMEKKDLVIRTKDKNDSRINFVELSPKGKEILTRLEPVWEDIHNAARTMVNEHAPHFIADLERIENALMETSNYTRIKRERLKRKPPLLKVVHYDKRYLKQFREINLQWLKEYVGVSHHDKTILKNPVKEILKKGGRIFFILSGKEVVGTFTLAPTDNINCELSKFVIKKNYRKLGFGEKMMDIAIAKAREAGYRSILLLTHPNLKEAIRLYTKTGFQKISGRSGLKDYTGRCSTCMKLNINL